TGVVLRTRAGGGFYVVDLVLAMLPWCWGKIFHEEITPASVFRVPAPRVRVPASGHGSLPPGLGPSSVFQATLREADPRCYYRPGKDICSLQHFYNSTDWLRPRSPAHQQGPSMLTEAHRSTDDIYQLIPVWHYLQSRIPGLSMTEAGESTTTTERGAVICYVMMVIGGRDMTSIPSEYFNPNHLGARNDITNWFLLVLGPILRSDFLQSLVPDGSWSCPQIRLLAVPGSCWFWVLSSDQTSCSPWFLLVLSPILRSDPRSLRICRFRVPTQSRCLQLLTPAGSGSSLHNKSQQPSDPMGAAITKQALDDIHTSRLTTPPHMRKMQGSQAGHNIFRRGLQLGRILKTGGVRRRAPGNTVKSNGSTKKQAPTTLLPLFPATNPDIPLKELKAFFPYKLLGKLRIRASPSLQGCTPRQVVRNGNSQALVPRSLQVLKDKSTGPPREVSSTPQERSPFPQGHVTGLRTMYPADECQSLLKHQQVHLR
ncbi:hypothetical protein HID58_013478, partial [Brassica napus]